ncbi:MAG: tyrosine--tRNA ligase [Gammaproteobacteria bacterium]|nr:tyrosine--tRNA ligase [Gammaproteobacteria bacterium]
MSGFGSSDKPGQGSILADLHERGLIAQVSDQAGLEAHLASSSRVVYSGFDPTADSLQIGNLVPLLTLRRLQEAGHRPILLVGGATGLIGDPSDKNEERDLNLREVVAEWSESVRAQAARFLDFGGDAGAVVVDNLDWTARLDVISFLRDIGKHFSVNAMTQREWVRSRLEGKGSGISYAEFSYTILQAMDFKQLAEQHGCTLQIGGSDQWGNIVSGVDLVRRTLGRKVFAATTPLATKADGTKFGKTQDGAVWLDGTKTSPYAFYQFLINTADRDVISLLGKLTFLAMEEIEAARKAVAKDPGSREAQRLLASEVTRLVHGEEGLLSARRITDALFSGSVEALTEVDFDQLALDGIDSTTIGADAGLVAVMAQTPLARSRTAARRLVQSKAVRVNGQLMEDPEGELSRANARYGRFHLIRRGKKSWHLVAHG